MLEIAIAASSTEILSLPENLAARTQFKTRNWRYENTFLWSSFIKNLNKIRTSVALASKSIES